MVVDVHAYGSEHLLRIEMNDKLGEQLVTRDLVKIKGELERRGHFRGVILEEFRRGKIMNITDSVVSLIHSYHCPSVGCWVNGLHGWWPGW